METPASNVLSAASSQDDIVLPFQAERAGANGRLVRLGTAIDSILTGHDYPEPVCRLLGEGVALTALLGASLKFEGKFTLQTKTDGPVSMLVIDYRSNGQLRGYARFDDDKIAGLGESQDHAQTALLGQGHLAMTIDRGPDMDSYQGVVALEGESLSEAADAYFRQSEQLPTFIRVAVARHYNSQADEDGDRWHWRAGGLMVQHLTSEGGHEPDDDADGDEDWNRARILASSVEEQELVDPMLEPERLLYRLFHEEGVRAFRAQPLEFNCGCSPGRVKRMLAGFSREDLDDMANDGKIGVTCEFCNAAYEFSPQDFA